MLSRPVQLIPTSLSSSEHHITHIKNEKNETTNSYPISMHFGLPSPTTNENPLAPLNVQVPHQHSYSTKNFDTTGHQAFIHMQLLSSTAANSESINSSQQSVQFTLPATHIYSSSPSSVLISTTPRSMDHNNNHQSTPTITTPIIREMQTDEKLTDSSTIKNCNYIKSKIFH